MKKSLAITLLELIVTLSIATVLALVTYGTFANVKIKYRRKEAQTELFKIKALIQEQAVKYSCNTIDIASWLMTGTAPAGCSAPVVSPLYPSSAPFYTTPNRFYKITLNITNIMDSAGNPAIQLTAQPMDGGPQIKDTDCTTITLITSMGMTDDTKRQGPAATSDVDCWQ